MVAGIDVSHYQGEIDWAAVAASETRFCFIKATDGMRSDRFFAKNWPAAKDAGLLRGAYHFFHPAIPAATQAAFFVKTVGPLTPGDLPPTLDLEGSQDWLSVAPSDRATLALQWLEVVESAWGVTPIVYLSPAFATEVLQNPVSFSRFPVWFAHYTGAAAPNLAAPWTAWNFWQYANDGYAAGMTSKVDLDRFNGSLEELRVLTVPA